MKVTTKEELIDCLRLNTDAELMNDIDMTGVHSIPVKSVLDLNSFTITCSELFLGSDLFLFLLNDGEILNGTISGPNGNSYGPAGKYFGAIRSTKGSITRMNFYNCDKWAVDCRGIRSSFDDTTFITGCNFIGTKRDGYGYSIWNQYNRAIVDNCYFDDGRHFIDGGSEAHYYDIRRCVFGERHTNFSINAHEYGTTGSRSGAGIIFMENLVFGTTQPIRIHNPFIGSIVIKDNKFECDASKVGTISGVLIAPDGNSFNGKGMNPAPVVDGKASVNKGEIISWKVSNYDKYEIKESEYNVGIGTHQITGIGLDGYRSLMTRKAVNVNDPGDYLSFMLKCNQASVEVIEAGVVIDTISPIDWTYFIYGSGAKLRLVGGGEVFLDDFCRNNIGETFETTNKIKISGYSTTAIKASRFIGESASGLYCMRFTLPAGSSVCVE